MLMRFGQVHGAVKAAATWWDRNAWLRPVLFLLRVADGAGFLTVWEVGVLTECKSGAQNGWNYQLSVGIVC